MRLGEYVGIAVAIAAGGYAIVMVTQGLSLAWGFQVTRSRVKEDPERWFEVHANRALGPSDSIDWFHVTGDVTPDCYAVRDVIAIVTDEAVFLHTPQAWPRDPINNLIERGDGLFRLGGGLEVIYVPQRLEIRGLPPQPFVDSLDKRGWLLDASESAGCES